MRCLFLSLVALAGCDNVFRLVPLPDPIPDALGDGTTSDGDDAAGGGCPLRFISIGDADGDSEPNDVDLCPGLDNAQVDSDGDGLGDQCDPHSTTPGDCIVLLDDFSNLDCWAAYETWPTCAGKPCTPSSGTTIDLRKPLVMDTAEIYGDLIGTVAGGPTISLLLNDSQPGEAVTGTACEVVNTSNKIGTRVASYSNDAIVLMDTSENGGMQPASEVPISLYVAWRTKVTAPNYSCGSLTSTTTIPLSAGSVDPSTGPPFGSHPVIRVSKTQLVPKLFIGYGSGSQCAQ